MKAGSQAEVEAALQACGVAQGAVDEQLRSILEATAQDVEDDTAAEDTARCWNLHEESGGSMMSSLACSFTPRVVHT